MQLFTTEILTLDEFSDRRKIGRTAIFNRIKSGQYQQHIDYVIDGNEKKFFWPDKEMVRRDMLLSKMITEADGGKVIQIEMPSIPISKTTTEPIMDNVSDGSAENIKSKPSRRDMPRVSRKTVVAGRAAFDI